MPWVDEEKCTGCGICVEECPVGAKSMENEKAEIYFHILVLSRDASGSVKL
ncbi:MAG: 4Fe-4S binding protein [Nitrospirae bacterium]|nr:4Fe-4S binding protein [Nitrospirota bacterium]